MADAQSEVLAFFEEWKPTLGDMLASMERRFTDRTVWENVGISKTTGFAEAKAFKGRDGAKRYRRKGSVSASGHM